MVLPADPPHPLFDPTSLDRLRCQRSVWSDAGERSIQQFFETLRARYCEPQPEPAAGNLRATMVSPGTSLPPFGSGGGWDTDPAEPPRGEALSGATAGGICMGGADAIPGPGMVRYDLAPYDRNKIPDVEREPTNLFTGLLKHERFPWERAWQFAVSIPELPAQRTCLVLIFTHRLVERMAGVLAADLASGGRGEFPRQPLATEAEVTRTLTAALDPGLLRPAEPEPAAMRRALLLAIAFSCAPTLVGTTRPDGTFTRTVKLIDHSPHLAADDRVVVCTGPEVSR
jgi:hypothetical protein